MTLRERKKQRTRLALIDAALDLFLAKGYDVTTIDEIVAAVDVSQRTFFRYFAAKEDVALGFMAEYDGIMVDTLAMRPAEESPSTALYEAMRVVLHAIEEGDAEETARFRKLRQVIETTPALVAGQMAQSGTTEKLLVKEIARRQGTDPETDLRPQLLVAIHMAAVRVGFEDCARHDVFEPRAVVTRVEESVALALAALKDGWDAPGTAGGSR
jgi:AcrR family transcriptional regulator